MIEKVQPCDVVATPIVVAQQRRSEGLDSGNEEFPVRVRYKNGSILIIDDDEAAANDLAQQVKCLGYRSITVANSARTGLEVIVNAHPDLVILDIYMADINGLEFLRLLRTEYGMLDVPVIVMTDSDDQRIRDFALQLDANEFLNKPVAESHLVELDLRIRNLLIQKIQHDELRLLSKRLSSEVDVRMQELMATRREAILCLARAAEIRDVETGKHVIRVGKYAAIIAESMGLGDDFSQWIELAAQLHDVGKLAIPDAILRKPGKYTANERTIMETHCDAARKIFRGRQEELEELTSPLMRMAARIAASHHERWDGAGYPNGLSGEDIPLEGRITAVADVFDALSTRRHYKDAFDIDVCLAMLDRGRGGQFDPAVLDAFFKAKHQVLAEFYALNGE
ncbi:MAG: response regulator [Planctomycetaceae bacterium]